MVYPCYNPYALAKPYNPFLGQNYYMGGPTTFPGMMNTVTPFPMAPVSGRLPVVGQYPNRPDPNLYTQQGSPFSGINLNTMFMNFLMNMA